MNEYYMPEKPRGMTIRAAVDGYYKGMLIDVSGTANGTHDGKCIITQVDHHMGTITVDPISDTETIYIRARPEIELNLTRGKQQPSYTKLHKGWKGRH